MLQNKVGLNDTKSHSGAERGRPRSCGRLNDPFLEAYGVATGGTCERLRPPAQNVQNCRPAGFPANQPPSSTTTTATPSKTMLTASRPDSKLNCSGNHPLRTASNLQWDLNVRRTTRGSSGEYRWGTGKQRTEPNWPKELPPFPLGLPLQMLMAACKTFPQRDRPGVGRHPPPGPMPATGAPALGHHFNHAWSRVVAATGLRPWDGWWWSSFQKPDGGRRPIGLLPLLPRVWSRVRRDVASTWERRKLQGVHVRWYGQGCGSGRLETSSTSRAGGGEETSVRPRPTRLGQSVRTHPAPHPCCGRR